METIGCDTLAFEAGTFRELIDISIAYDEAEKAHNDHLADLADAASY